MNVSVHRISHFAATNSTRSFIFIVCHFTVLVFIVNLDEWIYDFDRTTRRQTASMPLVGYGWCNECTAWNTIRNAMPANMGYTIWCDAMRCGLWCFTKPTADFDFIRLSPPFTNYKIICERDARARLFYWWHWGAKLWFELSEMRRFHSNLFIFFAPLSLSEMWWSVASAGADKSPNLMCGVCYYCLGGWKSIQFVGMQRKIQNRQQQQQRNNKNTE